MSYYNIHMEDSWAMQGMDMGGFKESIPARIEVLLENSMSFWR